MGMGRKRHTAEQIIAKWTCAGTVDTSEAKIEPT